MMRLVALALCAALLPAESAAFQKRESLAGGNSYYSQCVAGPKDYSACIGYFMGIADAPVMNTGKTPEEAVYCPQAGASYEQYRDVFHKFLRDNPQTRQLSTHHLFLMAMNASFPCTSSPYLSVDPNTGGVYISVPKPR
ncbi:hypothetical protein FG91_02164 [Sphingopyxis sp. LC81]|jgi:hypothetical protein|nr:hypothetical protein FG91_02164 [Sphingopyxis sp. LC81]